MSKSTHSAKYKKLVAALRDARRARGITQVELAKRLKKPQSFVAKYEQTERRLDIVEFFVVAEALNIDPLPILEAAGLVRA